METQVRTPQVVFMLPQRLVVPLFQRPYVWSQENQWEPLWQDVVRVAERALKDQARRPHPHFLGAVVLQQAQRATGLMLERTIIDGQQRLTTLQLLMDALHAELVRVEASASAMRLEPLVANAPAFCAKPEDRFKVWPTNRDRSAFNAVMGAPPPVDHDALNQRGERMVEAHRYFSTQAREWLAVEGTAQVQSRAAALETTVRDYLQMVVIDLAAEENAQEIFETLNARGAQLTAADLIKNFVFQRLQEAGADVEAVYERRWKDFETAFWETEIGVGRLRYPRSSIFLNHWLVAKTGGDVVAREVFDCFKRYADDESGVPIARLVEQIDEASRVYRAFIESAAKLQGPVDRLGLFGYRTGTLESEVIKPLVLWLLDPDLPLVPESQRLKAFDVVESWMVRRMLIRATTKDYNHVVSDLISHLRHGDRAAAGDITETYFVSQTSGSRYWPDDREVAEELGQLLAYRRLSRGRLRMVLEAIEDHRRGWRNGEAALGNERVARGALAIEHVMPRKWVSHWPIGDGAGVEEERERLIHTLGNLTLLTGRLNSKVSNGPWLGDAGKREVLKDHDVLILNRDLRGVKEQWTEHSIRKRTAALVQDVLQIWPVPSNHQSGHLREKVAAPKHRVGLADMIGAGILTAGMPLYPRSKKVGAVEATLLPDGRVEVNGKVCATPSEAAVSLTGHATNGWWFFLVSKAPKRALRDVWREYVDSLAVDAAEEDGEDGDDENGE